MLRKDLHKPPTGPSMSMSTMHLISHFEALIEQLESKQSPYSSSNTSHPMRSPSPPGDARQNRNQLEEVGRKPLQPQKEET